MMPRCRSPTVVISYLMRHRGWRLAESYKWVKEKRDTIKINPGMRPIELGHEEYLAQDE